MTSRRVLMVAVAALCGGLAGRAAAQQCSASECTGVSLPTSVDAFLELREKMGKTPQGGAVLFLAALMVREKDGALGEQLMVLATAESQLSKGSTYKGYALDTAAGYRLGQLDKNAYCTRGHVVGAEPKNRYAIPDPKRFAVKFRPQDKYVGSVESGDYKVFIVSSGTASARPMRMNRNEKGFWKTAEWSSFAVGCQAPKQEGPTAADEL